MIGLLGGRADDVGTYAEGSTPPTGSVHPNFPQALTHLGLEGNVGKQHAGGGGAAAFAVRADNAQRAVAASFGWRGVSGRCTHRAGGH